MDELSWEDFDKIFWPLFGIWVHGGDREWAKLAWRRPAKSGLASYDDDHERQVVIIRFVAVAATYHRFCRMTFEEGDDLDVLVGELNYSDEPYDNDKLNPFLVGQLGGIDADAADVSEAVVRLVRTEHSRGVSIYRPRPPFPATGGVRRAGQAAHVTMSHSVNA